MQALWGEPLTARSVSVDGKEVVPFRGDVTDLWLLAKQCTVTQWRQGPVERRRNGGAAQGSLWLVRFDPEDPIPRIGCFLSAFVHFLQTLPKEVSQSTATKVESGISDANRRFLVCESLETGKEGQNACQKNSDRVCLKGQLNTRCSGWRNKEQGSWTGILSRGNHRQSKPKSKYGICAGFWFDRRGHKAKRSDARFIYIYIANDENPSQHVSVGLAEARPKNSLKRGGPALNFPQSWKYSESGSGSWAIINFPDVGKTACRGLIPAGLSSLC